MTDTSGKSNDDSHSTLYGSWREETAGAASETEQSSYIPWQLQIDRRPSDYVGGYSPEWIQDYRRQYKKPIKIDGYNTNKTGEDLAA